MRPHHKHLTFGQWRVLFALAASFIIIALLPLRVAGETKYGPASFADLADSVKYPVVNLSTTQIIKTAPYVEVGPFREFFGEMPREMTAHALGSGFVIDRKGHILTNNHVIENASEIKVRLRDQREYDATVVGRDPKTELALIKVTPDAFFPAPAELGDSDNVKIGDWVMAVGNPFGLGNTVTVGIISAKGRIIGAGPYDDFLQTDAAINPGNSGGPLFDMNGKVVGISTAVVSQGQGIGFAIPINMAKILLPQLKAGKVVRGWLGLVIQDVTPQLAAAFGLEKAEGIIIAEVLQGGPADKAGLLRGDVILMMDNEAVKSSHAFSSRVAETPPNKKAEIQILRNGERKNIMVTIGTMPSEEKAKRAAPAAAEQPHGFSVQNLTPQIAQALGLGPDDHGVVVTQVQPGSPAQSAGLQPGDVIEEVDRQPIESMDQYQKVLTARKKEKEMLLLIKRKGHTLYMTLPAPAAK